MPTACIERRLHIRASHAVPNSYFPMALDMIQRGEIDPARFISHTFPLSAIETAVKTAAFEKEKAIKVVVECLEQS